MGGYCLLRLFWSSHDAGFRNVSVTLVYMKERIPEKKILLSVGALSCFSYSLTDRSFIRNVTQPVEKLDISYAEKRTFSFLLYFQSNHNGFTTRVYNFISRTRRSAYCPNNQLSGAIRESPWSQVVGYEDDTREWRRRAEPNNL